MVVAVFFAEGLNCDYFVVLGAIKTELVCCCVGEDDGLNWFDQIRCVTNGTLELGVPEERIQPKGIPQDR